MQGRLKSHRGSPNIRLATGAYTFHPFKATSPRTLLTTFGLHGAAMKKHSPNSETWRALQKFRAAYPGESQAQIFARFLSAKNAAAGGGRGAAPKKQLTFFDAAKFGNEDPKKI